jgi:hypothetical protein
MGKKPVAPGGENGENTIYKVSSVITIILRVEDRTLTLYRPRTGERIGLLDVEWKDD